jgi:hypothetical protein
VDEILAVFGVGFEEEGAEEIFTGIVVRKEEAEEVFVELEALV